MERILMASFSFVVVALLYSVTVNVLTVDIRGLVYSAITSQPVQSQQLAVNK